MFPMIISVEELRALKQEIAELKVELRNEGLPFDESIEVGVMIETPAAAAMPDSLHKVPIAVVDERDRLLGVVPRITLLAALANTEADVESTLTPIPMVPVEVIDATLKSTEHEGKEEQP